MFINANVSRAFPLPDIILQVEIFSSKFYKNHVPTFFIIVQMSYVILNLVYIYTWCHYINCFLYFGGYILIFIFLYCWRSIKTLFVISFSSRNNLLWNKGLFEINRNAYLPLNRTEHLIINMSKRFISQNLFQILSMQFYCSPCSFLYTVFLYTVAVLYIKLEELYRRTE